MKLVFNKDENENVSVLFQNGSETEAFSYSEMVKRIYYDQIIEDPVINGDFTKIECDSINELIQLLRKASGMNEEENILNSDL